MALIGLEDRFPFLKEIKLKELKNKKEDAIILKTIKFNTEERVLLKYITYLDKNFSTYVKQLIEKDMLDTLDENKNNVDNKSISEEYIMNLIEKALNKKENTVVEKHNDEVTIDTVTENVKRNDLLEDLSALNIRPR